MCGFQSLNYEVNKCEGQLSLGFKGALQRPLLQARELLSAHLCEVIKSKGDKQLVNFFFYGKLHTVRSLHLGEDH